MRIGSRIGSQQRVPSAQTPARLTSDAAKTSLLCLHGWRSNSDVSKAHVKNLNLENKFDQVHYLNGKFQAPEASDEVTASFFDGPYFSWVEKDLPSDVTDQQLKAALRHVVAHAAKNGPYDCVYGFSTGGLIAALLSMPEVLEFLGVKTQLWNRVIIACGARTQLLWESAERLLKKQIPASPLPSLHLIATEDRFKLQSEQLIFKFEAETLSGRRHAQYFSGGHAVPRELRTDEQFQKELRFWLRQGASSKIISSRLPSDKSAEPSGDSGCAHTLSETLQNTLLHIADEPTIVDAPGGAKLSFFEGGRALISCAAPELTATGYISMLEFISKASQQAEFIRMADSKALTYGGLLSFIRNDGDVRRLGVTSTSDVVCYPAPVGAAGAIVMLAISAMCCAAPLDANSVKIDVTSAIEQFGPRTILMFRGLDAPGFAGHLEEQTDTKCVWCALDSDGLFNVEDPAAGSIAAAPGACENTADGVGLLLRTSGTTSKPKVVPLTVGSLTSNGAVLASSLGLTQADCCLNAMPLFHIGGLSASILASMAAGASITCMPYFEPQSFLEHLTNGRPQPTYYSAVPTIHLAVLNYALGLNDGVAQKSHKLRFIRTGAAALSKFDANKLMDFWGVPVIPTYSMSEQMPISGSYMDPKIEQLDSVGMPLCCSIALIYESYTYPVLFEAIGEICISGPNVMKQYRDNPDANSKSYFYIGDKVFFRTGDMGKFDNEGHLRLTGRGKELIKRGGEQVSPPEVEAIVGSHASVKKAVVFAVPSKAWGEEVGCALVLKDDVDAAVKKDGPKGETELIADIRAFSLGILAASKVPAYWKIVHDSDLPKTSTKKYIRIGLAEVLGVQSKEAAQSEPSMPPPIVSSSLSGLRYLMGVGVMFNHICSATDDKYSSGKAFGQFKSSTFYFPATVFFVLGGFTLSAGLSGRPVRKLKKFYVARAATLHPQYLFAVLLALINLIITCTPSEYNDKFTFQREGWDLQCQSGAAVVPWGVNVILSAIVFALGLQAWPMFIPLTSWVLFYAWFSSVYYFIIAVFPFFHNAIARARGNKSRLLMWFGIASVLVYMSVGTLAVFYAFPDWTENIGEAGDWSHNGQNIYALATMLFPPYWIPCALTGTVTYFLYDAHRPYIRHNCWKYSWTCDVLTVVFVAWHIAMFANTNFPYPDFTNDIDDNFGADQNSGLNRYVWSVLCSRLKVPLIALWIGLLSMPGKSFTARLLEMPLLANTLGSTAYGCFLYHQIVGQWYFWATRGEAWDWWSFRKGYFWFSPKPMPGAWYEFFYVVILVSYFSMFVNAYIVGYVSMAWAWLGRMVSKIFGEGAGGSEELTPLELIAQALEDLLGTSVDLHEEDKLEHVGLGSLGLTELVSTINAMDDRLHLAVGDVAGLHDIGELTRLIGDALHNAENDAGVGFH